MTILNQVRGSLYVGQDSGGSISSSTTETSLSQIQITGGTVQHGILIIATIKYTDNSTIGGDKSGTFRLYSGTNASFGSNTNRESVSMSFNPTTTSSNPSNKLGVSGTLSYALTSEEDWTGDVYIDVTGQNPATTSGISCAVTNMVIIAL